MCGLNEFRRAAKLGAGPRSRYDSGGLAAPHQSPCKRVSAGTCVNGEGFARKHRLVELNRPAGQVHIRGHDSAKRQLHLVAAHQFRRWYCLPFAVPLDRGVECQTRFESSESCQGAAFLEVSQSRVENEQRCYDTSFVILMQDGLKHDGRFKQPWHGSPEFGQSVAQWMSRRVRHCIGPVLFKKSARFFACEASWCAILSRSCDLPVGCRGDKSRRAHDWPTVPLISLPPFYRAVRSAFQMRFWIG